MEPPPVADARASAAALCPGAAGEAVDTTGPESGGDPECEWAARRGADPGDRCPAADAAAMRWPGRRVSVYAYVQPTGMRKYVESFVMRSTRVG
jgi:hypothetical protein